MVKIEDKNYTPIITRRIEALHKTKVRIGVKAPSGHKLYMIGWVHEFGIDIPVTDKMRGWFLAQEMPLKKSTKKIHIPERSYMRTAFDENKAALERMATKLFGDMVAQKITPRQVQNKLGKFMQDKVQDKINAVDLIDTGTLKDSIKAEVVSK